MRLLLSSLLLASLSAGCATVHGKAQVFEDPRGDDHGPGTYLPPTGSEFRSGDFDLRRFSVWVEGEDAVLEVTLGAHLRRDIVAQRTNAASLELTNGIFVQHVDIYIDTQPGAGFVTGLPGRRVRFRPEEAWDLAVTLTPQPGPTRTVLEGWNREVADRVLTPGPLRPSGNSVRVRVPLWRLGGPPKPTWGWSVMVSGATWEHSFEAFNRIRGAHAPDAFTLPVYGVPEERAFGGATLRGAHPYVIDVLLPEGTSQEQVLGSFSSERLAVVPMVYRQRPPQVAVRVQEDGVGVAPVAAERAAVATNDSDGKSAGAVPSSSEAASDAPTSASPGAPETASAPAQPSPTNSEQAQQEAPQAQDDRPSHSPQAPVQPSGPLILEIANVQGDTVVIPAPNGGVSVWQIGVVLDAEGRQLGRVVVTSASQGFLLATLTEGKSRVTVGNKVRFTPPRARPPSE